MDASLDCDSPGTKLVSSPVYQRLGGVEKIDEEDAIVAAERLAASSDVVVVVAGLSPDWESEGFDRPHMK